MIDIRINPESIERFRSALCAASALRFSDTTIPVLLDGDMPIGSFGIAAMSPWFQEYWEAQRRTEILLHTVVQLTSRSGGEIRALAAGSPLSLDDYLVGLMHDTVVTR